MIMLRFEDERAGPRNGPAGNAQSIEPGAEPGAAILAAAGGACDGLAVDVELAATRARSTRSLIAVRFGLPPEGGRLQALRPGDAHPQYGADSTIR